MNHRRLLLPPFLVLPDFCCALLSFCLSFSPTLCPRRHTNTHNTSLLAGKHELPARPIPFRLPPSSTYCFAGHQEPGGSGAQNHFLLPFVWRLPALQSSEALCLKWQGPISINQGTPSSKVVKIFECLLRHRLSCCARVCPCHGAGKCGVVPSGDARHLHTSAYHCWSCTLLPATRVCEFPALASSFVGR